MKQNSKFALLKQIIIQSNEEKNAKKVGNKINAKSTFQKKWNQITKKDVSSDGFLRRLKRLKKKFQQSKLNFFLRFLLCEKDFCVLIILFSFHLFIQKMLRKFDSREKRIYNFFFV